MLGLVLRRASFQRNWYWQLLTSSIFFTGTVALWDCAHAQIATDTTLGNESSIVTPNVIINGIVSDRIDGGAIRGINLFHSFSEFNIGEGRGVYFSNPAGTENILSRVTGNNSSNILGTLGVTGGNANLFLINPKGIIFGTNASLDVKGSFVATTANGIQFDNLGIFSATNPEAPSSLLTINPRALFFNQINQNAAIQNSSIAPAGIDPAGSNALGLRVPDGKSLLLVGGNVNMDGGKLNAYGGRVELGGLAEPGNITLSINGDNQSLRFPDNVARTDVLLINQAAINVEGAGSGNIAINTRNIEILKESALFAGIGRGLGTPETVAGDITLNATGEIKVAGRSRIANSVFPGALGNGGNITINSGSLSLPDDAQLSTSTLGQGNAGNVIVQAKSAVSLVDGSILSTVEAGGVGKGGNIDINAASLSLIDSAQLLTFTRGASDTQRAGQGDAGNVNLKVTGVVDIAGEKDNLSSGIRSSVATGTVGNGGNITIESGSFSLRDGARLSASTFEQGNAGNIDINVTGAVTISGKKDGNMSAIFSAVEAGGVGKGGNITIDSGSFSLRDSAQLVASTSGIGNAGNVTVRAKDGVSLVDGIIFSTVQAGGMGKGGNIDINAASLSLTNSAQLQTITFGASDTQPAGQGDAGNVNLKVTGSVDIAGVNSAIGSLVDTGTVGNGGNITIDSGSFSLRDGAQLVTSTFGIGNAGNVTVRAKDAVSFVDGIIRSTVQAGGVGKGGNIDINAATFSLTDGAQLEASTYGQGNAGNVTVQAKDAVSLVDGNIFSAVDAGGLGKGGNIDINAATLSLINGAQLLTITRGASDTQPPGRGDAGNVNVKVTGIVDIAGEKNGFPSGIRSLVDTGTVGNGGNITIDSGSFSLQDGAQVVSSTFGQGNAGNVNVKVTGAVNVAGEKNGFGSAIFSAVGTGAKGNGGDITINSDSFLLRDGAQLETSTYGQGNAGNVTVQAKDAIFLTGNAYILSAVEAGGVGKGGNIDINAASLTLRDGAQLITITRGASDTQPAGRGEAGNVNLKVTGKVDIAGEKNGFLSGIRSDVDTGTVGNGGNITIDSGSFSLQDGAQVSSSTFGQGNAGNINVKVTGEVNIAREKNGFASAIFSGVRTGAKGNGGDITINSDSLLLRDIARLEASTYGQGNAGNVTVRAKDAVFLTGNAYILSAVEAGGVGQGGSIDINAASLTLRDGSQLLTFTREAFDTRLAGRGNAGNINVKVTGKVDISGEKNGFSSGIASAVLVGTEGNGGNITIDSGSFSLRDDGAFLDARTRNDNKGGNITVNTDIFEVLNGGQLITTTSSNGRAGKITVNATEKVIISGSDPNYNNRLTQFSDRVVINVGANSGFFVSSSGSGITGDIEINSPKITLDNQGKLNAESASGNGGNININSNLLLLRRGAQISTTAGTAEKGGDGGNININSKFIVAVPNENSDITANAFTGRGGNINIRSQGIFGIEARSKPSDITNDITASSNFGSSGIVDVVSPDNSSIQNNLAELSQTPIDTNALIANSCIVRTDSQEGTFIITGSGGLPYRPGDISVSTYPTGDVRNVQAENVSRPWQKGDPIVEPSGVYQLASGQLVLSRKCSQ